MPNFAEPASEPVQAFPASLEEFFIARGWNRLLGRVVGELMLAEPPALSTRQLCERVGASKSHMSSATTMLQAMNMIDRFGRAGSREHHYRLREDAFIEAARAGAEPSRKLALAAERACADVPPGSRAHEQLTRLREFYLFLARRFPELVTEFEAEFEDAEARRAP